MRLIKLESFEQGEVFVKLHLRSLESVAKFFQVLCGVENSVSKLNQHCAERNYDIGRSQSKLTVRERAWHPAHS